MRVNESKQQGALRSRRATLSIALEPCQSIEFARGTVFDGEVDKWRSRQFKILTSTNKITKSAVDQGKGRIDGEDVQSREGASDKEPGTDEY